MSCIEKIYSVSAVIGNGSCNGNCSFCSGKTLGRGQRNEILHQTNMRNLEFAIKLSAKYGGWSLSLTSAGEPTCDPDAITEALTIYQKCVKQGAYFPNVNIFTNGIIFGDSKFCDRYLPIWKELGLTNIVVSVHHYLESEQAKIYGIKQYPLFKTILQNVKKHGIGVRSTILLRNGGIDTPDKFNIALNTLFDCGYNNITSWTVGNPDGTRNEYTPSRWNVYKIWRWLAKNGKLCHSHEWGGGVYDIDGKIVRLTDYVTKHDPKKDFVRQLVVLQDGGVYYSWIKEGAICQLG
jgi:sulfatase maturation enzyme AslB (radical SAM superfamily)